MGGPFWNQEDMFLSSYRAVRRFMNDNDILLGSDWSEGVSLINVYFSYLEYHLVQQQQQQHLICHKGGTNIVTNPGDLTQQIFTHWRQRVLTHVVT